MTRRILGAGRRLLPSRTFTPSFLLYLWFRGAVDPRKNTPRGTVSSSASTLDEADRRIMQSRLTRRSSTTFARPSPSIIGRGSSVVVALLPDDSSSESSLLASLLGISRVRYLVRETRDCIPRVKPSVATRVHSETTVLCDVMDSFSSPAVRLRAARDKYFIERISHANYARVGF